MSWMKRPRASPAPQQPPPPGAAPPASLLPHQSQLATNQPQQWQQGPPNDVPPAGYAYGNINPPHPMQQHYWQQPPQAPNQQNTYNHNFNQQNFPHPQAQAAYPAYQYNQQQYANPNSNTYSPHQQNFNAYNQPSIPNQQYNASQVPQQPNFTAPRNNLQGPNVGDQDVNESDPWNWGWDDGSAVENQNAQKLQASTVQNVNANVLSDSFTNSNEGWNYCAPESNQIDNHQSVNINQMNRSRTSSRDNMLKEDNSSRILNKESVGFTDPVQYSDNASLGKDMNVSQESTNQKAFNKVPDNKASINKTHIGNIPHGWSTESQPSQESSDGLLSHTESTTGSEDPSRSFDKNSPAFSVDNTNFNYVQSPSDFFSENSYSHRYPENVSNVVNTLGTDDNVNQELVDSINTLHLSDNIENIVPNKNMNVQEVERIDALHVTSQEVGNANLGHNLSAPSGRDSNSPNLPNAGLNKPPIQLPPISTGNPQSNTNPFKRAGQISHRATNKNIHMQASNTPLMPLNQQPIQDVPFQQDISNLRQPSPLTHVDDSNNSTNRLVHHANLETTPDNSERPDNPSPVQYPPQYPHAAHQPIVENLEIAPNNDRNEYLQTGHLSETGFNDNLNYRDTVHSERRNNPSTGAENYPPPGLRRMVLGQPESQFNQSSNFTLDEPPPGLSRMVPGHPSANLNMYNQSNDDYLDRQIDGQTTESDSLTNSACMAHNPTVYRQVDGQPTDDESNYNQTISSRSSLDRRPVGFDRMVPGEASNSNFNMSTFQNQSFSSTNEERIVTGFGHINSTETREQNVDGSDYSEVDTNQIRNVVGATESSNDSRNQENSSTLSQNITVESDLQQRDRNMEGENLQDLSAIASTDFSMIRDQNMDGADTREEVVRKVDQDSGSDRIVNPKTMPNQQLPNDIDRKYRDDTTGDESERDRMYKINSLRKEKEGSRMRTSRERDNRYNDRREERRPDKDRRGDYRGERDGFRNDERYYRKVRDNRYDTEDTDYYSDRDRRRFREGSYSSSKPPRSDDRRRDDDSRKSYDRTRDDREKRRRDDPDRDRRYDSYESERDGNTGRRRDREKDRDYVDRDDDRHRRNGTVERERTYSRRDRGSRDDRKRNDVRYRPSRPDSRDPDPTEDEPFDENSTREHRRERRNDDRDRDYDRDRRSQRHRRDKNDQYYERYGYPMDAYSQHIYQQQTYQYYEKLRITNPQAYLEFYNKYMAGTGQNISQSDVSRAMSGYSEGYTSLPNYDANTRLRLGEDRGSVHSGRSSANGEAIKDRMLLDGSGGYYYPYRRIENPTAIYMKQDTPTRTRGDLSSVRTDYSGSRDFNTDASLNQFLDDSTVKSERLTPVKFATVHIKGDISSSNLVVINPSYPSDGQPAVVEILNINKVLANDPIRIELFNYPGPLIKGTTHKKTVIEFCELKIRAAIEKYTSLPSSDKGIYTNPFNVTQPDKNAPSHVTDLGSIVLMWELLILLLRQNGMVVGTDIAELLVKNKNQYVWRGHSNTTARSHSRRDSASSATSRSADLPVDDTHRPPSRDINLDADPDSSNETSLQSLTGSKKERKPSKDNSTASRPTRKPSVENSQHIQNEEKYVTDKFREYLLFGSGKDALEWAMSHGLWGHALFLASKLDRRTYANVMARFANGLAPNDPLQTLYQLMSGRQPASVTCVLDEKWGDWRPHLAMILSNTSQRPDLDKKSITTLGDTLQARGDLYAAQFCYLMARVEFGKRPIKLQSTSNAPRLILLGSSSSNENFSMFASNEAIMMTEIYEYACSLNDNAFVLTDFQFYKYLLATRLMDYGFYDRALFYMENIAHVISQHSDKYDFSFVNNVLQIADRLKYYDPEENIGEIVNDNIEQTENDVTPQIQNPLSEKAWITNLRQIVHEFNMSDPMHAHVPQFTNSISSQYDPVQPQFQNQYQNQNWNQQQYQNYNSQLQQQQLYNQQVETDSYNQPYVQDHQYVEQHSVDKSKDNETNDQPQMYDPNYSQNNSMYYNTPGNTQYTEQDSSNVVKGNENQQNDSINYGGVYQSDSSYWNTDEQNQHSYGYNEPEPVKETPLPETTDNEIGDVVDQPRPQISMPNAMKPPSNTSYYDDDIRDEANGQKGQQSSVQQKPKDKPKKDESAANKTQASSGWFGGIFNKLSLKPKNQMILPDDKNPTIVWDPEKKKWTNLDADEDEKESQLAPPPKMPEIFKQTNSLPSQNQPMPTMQQNFPPSETGPNTAPPSVNTPNIFKLQKSRHIKKSYVDVFNPSGAPMRPIPPASEVLGVSQMTAAPQNYFVPQNSNDQQTQMAPSFYNPSDYAS